ncbi:hypothetical protein [Cellulosilyticum sp. I15G10I2]|uniref:hypothetical protein n=1 Tax=Cellulosilyticum sp. I15G10I2 TaxID=1892843 RepID=UPI00114D06FF|nr:hypothetical protein [Cellulosilyticum sp. I15G10I2]
MVILITNIGLRNRLINMEVDVSTKEKNGASSKDDRSFLNLKLSCYSKYIKEKRWTGMSLASL